mgnify:CR=1 FL=1
MQGRLIAFRQLRPILEKKFNCAAEFFPEGAAQDPDGAASPPVFAFIRNLGAGQVLLSTIVVYDDRLPIFETHLRSFLARLRLTFDDIVEHL